ncbi:MAG: hypothetical protein KGI89_15685 [Euryarchaeota archaeon]|nr:hypothetical protein [Euryarchaeota archaeon]
MAGLLLVSSPVATTAPPLERAVAPYYERQDGLDPLYDRDGQPASFVPTPLGDSYGPDPRPGQRNTRGPIIGGIPGKVGSIGATPIPVDYPTAPSMPRETIHVQTPTTQFNFGPGGAAPGLAQTITMTEITANPPQPGDLTSILAGLS